MFFINEYLVLNITFSEPLSSISIIADKIEPFDNQEPYGCQKNVFWYNPNEHRIRFLQDHT